MTTSGQDKAEGTPARNAWRALFSRSASPAQRWSAARALGVAEVLGGVVALTLAVLTPDTWLGIATAGLFVVAVLLGFYRLMR